VSGLPKFLPHGCRKTANSTWAAAGVELGVRNAWGGWSGQGMADGTYLRLRPEVHEKAAQLVAAYQAEYAPSSAAL
jgi:integrase